MIQDIFSTSDCETVTIFRIHVHKHYFFHVKFWKINKLHPYIGKPETKFHHFSMNCHYFRLVHSKTCVCGHSVILQYLMWPPPAAPLHAAQSHWASDSAVVGYYPSLQRDWTGLMAAGRQRVTSVNAESPPPCVWGITTCSWSWTFCVLKLLMKRIVEVKWPWK